MGIKLVIFDMDGTIVKTAESYTYSMNQVLKEEGFPQHDVESYIRWMGAGFRNLTKQALPQCRRGEKELDDFTRRMDESYGKHWDYRIGVYDGVYELLDELVQRGIALGINTNKVDDKAKKIVKNLFSKYGFADIIGNRPDVPDKPNPLGARIIMEKANATPQETIYVGDSEYDIETAINAGAIPVAVKWGYRDVKLLQKSKGLLGHPLELLEYIDQSSQKQ